MGSFDALSQVSRHLFMFGQETSYNMLGGKLPSLEIDGSSRGGVEAE